MKSVFLAVPLIMLSACAGTATTSEGTSAASLETGLGEARVISKSSQRSCTHFRHNRRQCGSRVRGGMHKEPGVLIIGRVSDLNKHHVSSPPSP